MPRYAKRTRRIKRRTARPRRKRFNRKAKIARSMPIGGFGRSQLVRLRYVENLTFNAVAGGISFNAFRANGPQDPNYTGVGHQPSNWDRWILNFDRYTCVGSRIVAQPFQTLTTGVNPGTIFLHLSEAGDDLATAHASGGIENMLEQPRLSWSSRSFGQNNGSRAVSLRRNFSAKRFFKGFKAGAQPYTSDISTNPLEGAFYEVAVASPDDTSDPGAIQIRVIIDYIVLFAEPKLADAS